MKVILLPGLNGTAGLFKPFMQAKPDGIETLTITYPTQIKQDYQLLTHSILQKIKHLEEDFLLLGESFSGPLALFVASHHPKHLKGVILVGSFITAPNFRLARYLPWLTIFRLTTPAYRVINKITSSSHKSFITTLFSELQKVKPVVLADRIQFVFSVDAQRALKKCSLPIAYFKGRKDRLVPPQNLRKIIRIKDDIKVFSFNTQHFILQSDPEKAWHAILQFSETLQKRY